MVDSELCKSINQDSLLMQRTPVRQYRVNMFILVAIGLVTVVNLPSHATGAAVRMVCPPHREILPCTCKVMMKGLDIVCENSEEKQIRTALELLKKRPFTIYWMKIRNCNLPRMADYTFLGLDVRHLHIIRSNVSVIERSSLAMLGSTLESLDLANNNLERVPSDALQSLKKLSFLNLNYNSLVELTDMAFYGLTALERLSLYANQIHLIRDDTFKGLRRLRRLNLGKNRLTEIPPNALHNLAQLETLDVQENLISRIHEGTFSGLTKLDMLRLEHNQIESLQDDVFSGLPLLNRLNIENNYIESISDKAFNGLENILEWLELGSNRLDHVPSTPLRPLHNLRQLDLDSNRITAVEPDAFTGFGSSLRYLILNKNNIASISTGTFEGLISIEWLALSDNDLTTFNQEIADPIIGTLKHIDLSNNPLECTCNLQWLWSWLNDPNTSEPPEEAYCMTRDRKLHSIKNLPVDDLACPIFEHRYHASKGGKIATISHQLLFLSTVLIYTAIFVNQYVTILIT
ncbi:unnamed protein product, partial [Meganyctiphanes norvegica]